MSRTFTEIKFKDHDALYNEISLKLDAISKMQMPADNQNKIDKFLSNLFNILNYEISNHIRAIHFSEQFFFPTKLYLICMHLEEQHGENDPRVYYLKI